MECPLSKAQGFPVTESGPELNSLRKKQTNLRTEKRIIWLLELQKRRFRTRKELSVYLNISTGAQEHVTTGIEGLLSDKPKNIKSGIIAPEIHEGLSKRVNSSDSPFLGYWSFTVVLLAGIWNSP